MQNLDIQNKRQSKTVLDMIKKHWDPDMKILDEFVLMKNNKDKYYVVNREVFDFPLDKIRISKLGLYFGELHNGVFRLSIEGSQLVGKKAKQNIVELDDEQIRDWIKGNDIDLDHVPQAEGFVLIKNNNAFFGCGKISKKENTSIIFNYYPKIRRVYDVS